DRCAGCVHSCPLPIVDQTGAAAPTAGGLRLADIRRARRPDVVWTRSLRHVSALSFLCRSHLQGSQAGRSFRSAANEVRTRHQPQNCEGARPHNSRQAARASRRGDRMKRRNFIALLGGAAAAWPLTARAQQPGRMRRIGVLVSNLAADDPEWPPRSNAFVQGLQERGWSDGRTVRVEYRWGLGDPDRLRKYAAELVALAPDVILAAGTAAVVSLQQSNRSVPIVFANVLDPVGAGLVATLARPGGNATGFARSEFGLSAKLLELLKQVAPRVARVAVVRNQANPFDVAQFGAIQAVAPSLGVELTPIIGRDPGEIERDITAFGRGQNGGLIVTGAGLQQIQRDAIIAAVATHRLPAVYPF